MEVMPWKIHPEQLTILRVCFVLQVLQRHPALFISGVFILVELTGFDSIPVIGFAALTLSGLFCIPDKNDLLEGRLP